MKRSKALLTSNILATLYSASLLWVFGGAIIKAGGTDFIRAMSAYFKFAFELLGVTSPTANFLLAIVILLWIHIICFVLGCIIGWIAFACGKSGGAKAAAILYLIGTICFPVYLVFGLPITIVGFVGSGKQKDANR